MLGEIQITEVPEQKRDAFNNIRAYVKIFIRCSFGLICLRDIKIVRDVKKQCLKVIYPKVSPKPICDNCGHKNAPENQYCGKCANFIVGKNLRKHMPTSTDVFFPADESASVFLESKILQAYASRYGNEFATD